MNVEDILFIAGVVLYAAAAFFALLLAFKAMKLALAEHEKLKRELCGIDEE